MFSIICKSPGEQILHTALRGAELCGGGGEGIPSASILPCATEYFCAKPVVPSAGLRDRKTRTLEGEQSRTGKPDIYGRVVARNQRCDHQPDAKVSVLPPSPPRPHTFGTDEALVNVHSVQTNYPPPKLPRKHTQTRTHSCHTNTEAAGMPSN